LWKTDGRFTHTPSDFLICQDAKVPCPGELMIALVEGNDAEEFLYEIVDRVVMGKIDMSKWEEGTIISGVAQVNLCIHVLNEKSMEFYLGTKKYMDFGIPRTTKAFQMVLANAQNKFLPTETAHQLTFDSLPQSDTDTDDET
jgi:hypothetical protein